MAYRIDVDEVRGLVIVTATGPFEPQSTIPMITEARGLAGPRRFNLLYDFRGATPGSVGESEVFWYARKLPVLREANARQVRVALLHKPKDRELANFWETTFRNVGLKTRAFEQEAEAFAWLAQ
jgi:hypothetical protein